jgi:hypothetical protein
LWNMHCDKRRWHGIEVIYKWGSITLFFSQKFILVLHCFAIVLSICFCIFVVFLFFVYHAFFLKTFFIWHFFLQLVIFLYFSFSLSTTLSLLQLVSCCLSISYLSLLSNLPFLSFHSYFFLFLLIFIYFSFIFFILSTYHSFPLPCLASLTFLYIC